MYCWPSENSFHHTIIRMDIYTLRRCDLMVRAAITNNVDKTIFGNVIYKPRNLIGMRFDDNFIFCFWIDYPYCSTIVINICFIHKRFQIIQPKALTFPFKSRWRGIVYIFFKEFYRFFGYDRLMFYFFTTLLCHVYYLFSYKIKNNYSIPKNKQILI